MLVVRGEPADLRVQEVGKIEGCELQQGIGLEVVCDHSRDIPGVISCRVQSGHSTRHEDTLPSQTLRMGGEPLRQEFHHARKEVGDRLRVYAIAHKQTADHASDITEEMCV
ncbi:hypothetical protein GCM10010214_12260 [Streptomyces abikoensis]|nr:hypothetical protein GCM10010214_12260 [Streptomyces abikoensis]